VAIPSTPSGTAAARAAGLASIRRDVGGFNDQWLQHLSWTLLLVDGEVARYRVRSPISVRDWLIVRSAAAPSEQVFQRIQHEYGFRQYLDPAWAIIPVALISTVDGPFMVLDENAGASLHEVLGERLSITRFLRLAIGAARAVASAHAAGLLHHDIKPCNLIEGSDGVVRLSAFALSRYRHGAEVDTGEAISGSFAYMPPEQAGRLQQQVDERSDLYALGVSFYELLTGRLPFEGNDPVESLHQHLTQPPPPIEQWRASVPAPLRRVVLKLLAKEPAARYACAGDLADDLRLCLVQWSEFQHIRRFEPGGKGPRGLDLPVAVLIGRERELAQLHGALARCVASGQGEMVLLSGQTGTGKSALVRQLHQDLIIGRVLFAAGKFDQSSKTTPYASLSLALRSLALRVLGEPPLVLAQWRARLLKVLGADAALMAPLVPELELITGPLPPLAEAAALGARHRFDDVLRKFIGAFAQADTPLVLFFDDVQWLDHDTLGFIRSLIEAPLPHLLLIAACREICSDPTQAFYGFIESARARPAHLTELHLSPLSPADLHAMVCALLGWNAPQLAPLSVIIHDKSAGNPFFVHQLLRTLLEEKLLWPDPAGEGWQWDAQGLARFPVADNVVDLMVARIGRFPRRTQFLLGLLAMVGNRADSSDIARISELSLSKIQRFLAPAVEAGLLIEDRQGLSFSHDRVREAAYQLIAPERRAAEHTRLARLLLKTLPAQRVQGDLFRIALHIQQSAHDALMEHEKPQFIDALLSAAERARETAALPFALQYLRLARELGGLRRWSDNPAQSYAVDYLHAQCLVHTCDYANAHACIDQLLERVSALPQVSALYVLKIEALSLAGDYAAALQTGLGGLRLFGIDFPTPHLMVDLQGPWQQLREAQGERSIFSFIDHFALNNAFIQAALDLMAAMLIPVSFSDRDMMFLLSCRMVAMTFRHGVCTSGVRGLSWFGVVLAERFDAPEDGLRFTDLAARLAGLPAYTGAQPSSDLALGRISLWLRTPGFALECSERAFNASRAQGRPGLGCYASHQAAATQLFMGTPLAQVQVQLDRGRALAGMLDFRDSQLLLDLLGWWLRALREGAIADTHRPELANEIKALEARVQASSMTPVHFWLWLVKGMHAYFAGEHLGARDFFAQAQRSSWSVPGHVPLADLALYSALNHAQLCTGAADVESTLQAIEPHLRLLQRWAHLNPQSFRDRFLLVDAQVASLRGDGLRALGLLESAVAQSASAGFVHLQALAHEVAAQCNTALGLSTAARAHRVNARDSWQRWGAASQVRRLESAHLYLQSRTPDSRASVDLLRGQQYLDLVSVTKASQALSREIVFERLVETLVANTLVHAGARRGLLMLLRDGEPMIVATGLSAGTGVEVALECSAVQGHLPLSILYRVMRTGQTVALERAERDESFAADPYFLDHCGGSVLCLPLLKQGEVLGVLYLDNSLAAGVFTHARVAMIELLAAQAAISLETSRLYGELLEENSRRRETEASLQMARAELAQVSHSTVLGELAASIAHEINQPLVSIVSNASASVRWLQRAQPEVQEALEGLRDITKDGKRAADIIHALQALARQKASNRRLLSIDEVIRHVLLLTAVEIDQRGITVKARLEAGDCQVMADGVQMQQVVYNLIVNACDAMAGVLPQQRWLTIGSSLPCRDQLVVTIEDTGTGISRENQEQIFNAFFTTKSSGMGMGLAICRSIMNAQGGTLHMLQGRQGQTVFVFTLPC
jgi:predicted ATPase/signal transduction histidine kinase